MKNKIAKGLADNRKQRTAEHRAANPTKELNTGDMPPTGLEQYAIKSTERNSFFVAIHGFTPFFSTVDKARKFTSKEMATAYARTELFTSDSAFEILPVS